MKKLILSGLFVATIGLLAGCSKSPDNSSQAPAQAPAQPPPSATHTNTP